MAESSATAGPAVALVVVGVGLAPVAAAAASADYRFVEGGQAIAADIAVAGLEVEIAAAGLSGPLAS